jgi:hypothetical protein
MRDVGLIDHLLSLRVEDDRLWSEEERVTILIAAHNVFQYLGRKKVKLGIACAALKHALRMIDEQNKCDAQKLMSYAMPKAKIIPFPRKKSVPTEINGA